MTKLVIGGLALKDDISSIENFNYRIIIGTSGRLIQLYKMGKLNFLDFDFIVLDEYDKLFDNKQFLYFLKLVKKSRKDWVKKTIYLCFSATYIGRKFKILKNNLKNVQKITILKINKVERGEKKFMEFKKALNEKGIKINENKLKLDINNNNITQYYIKINTEISKDEMITKYIKKIIKEISFKKLIIFYNKKIKTDFLWEDLRYEFKKEDILYIHGDLQQKERLKKFITFKYEKKNRIIITTDILSRGVDIDNIDLVINYDFPYDIETYFHRIGRVGRYKNKGISFIFLTNKLKKYMVKNKEFVVNLKEFNFNLVKDINESIKDNKFFSLNTNLVKSYNPIGGWGQKFSEESEKNFKYKKNQKKIKEDNFENIMEEEIGYFQKKISVEKKFNFCVNCDQHLNLLNTYFDL